MSRILLLFATYSCLACSASAQVREFPYKARITAADTYARSGGGEAFYPTQLLPVGTVVNVRRHDRGGWYMIDPPKGSFSWVPQKYVEQTGPESGVLRESNVIVFVGSSFGDETHVWQRKMTAGEEVKVIGQRMVDTLQGPKQMLKIHPPAREFRWVPGAAVVPVDDAKRQERDSDPYLEPSSLTMKSSPEDSAVKAQTDDTPAVAPSNRLARLKAVREEQRKLYELDQRFRSMLLSDPSQWDLASIENEYLELQQTITHRPLAGQIDLRYPAIQRYRVRKAEFDELNQLTTATEKRDAELMASQYGIPADSSANGFDGNTGVAMTPPLSTNVAVGIPTNPTVALAPGGMLPLPILSGTDGEVQQNDELIPQADGSGIPNIPENSEYIGAGFLQRGVGEEQSAFLLMSPKGKVLARVKPKDDEVDLEKFVGRAVGLKGSRWFDDQVKSDYIEVSGLEEVRIRK